MYEQRGPGGIPPWPPQGYDGSAPPHTHRSRRRTILLVAEADDLDELVGVQRGTADEGTVHVGLRHDGRDVPRLHRAAVLDADGVGQLLRVELGQPAADRTADLLGVLGGGDLAGP